MHESLKELPEVKVFIDSLCQKGDNSNYFRALGTRIDCSKCADKCVCFTYGITTVMYGMEVKFCNKFRQRGI